MLTLQRSGPDGDVTRGTLTDDTISGLQLVTIEPNPPKVPAGHYPAIRYFSPHFSRDVVRLLDVPGHTGIEIHLGNTAADTEGCILVGERVATDADGFGRPAIVGSGLALASLMATLAGDRFTVVVMDP